MVFKLDMENNISRETSKNSNSFKNDVYGSYKYTSKFCYGEEIDCNKYELRTKLSQVFIFDTGEWRMLSLSPIYSDDRNEDKFMFKTVDNFELTINNKIDTSSKEQLLLYLTNHPNRDINCTFTFHYDFIYTSSLKRRRVIDKVDIHDTRFTRYVDGKGDCICNVL